MTSPGTPVNTSRSTIDIIARAVRAERERCARIAERFAVANLVDEEPTDCSSVAQSIANTIREGARP